MYDPSFISLVSMHKTSDIGQIDSTNLKCFTHIIRQHFMEQRVHLFFSLSFNMKIQNMYVPSKYLNIFERKIGRVKK